MPGAGGGHLAVRRWRGWSGWVADRLVRHAKR